MEAGGEASDEPAAQTLGIFGRKCRVQRGWVLQKEQGSGSSSEKVLAGSKVMEIFPIAKNPPDPHALLPV